MTYGFRGLGEPKIKPGDESKRPVTGSEKGKEPIDTPGEEVDPAEFFDPEEFGVRQAPLSAKAALGVGKRTPPFRCSCLRCNISFGTLGERLSHHFGAHIMDDVERANENWKRKYTEDSGSAPQA